MGGSAALSEDMRLCLISSTAFNFSQDGASPAERPRAGCCERDHHYEIRRHPIQRTSEQLISTPTASHIACSSAVLASGEASDAKRSDTTCRPPRRVAPPAGPFRDDPAEASSQQIIRQTGKGAHQAGMSYGFSVRSNGAWSGVGRGPEWQVASVVGVDNEAGLVRQARAGDGDAFVELIGTHRNAAWAVCLRITGNPHDAEDALQDTLVAAWRNIAQFRSDARFSTWLFRIGANAALAIVRRRPEIVEYVDRVATGGDPGDRVADADRVQMALLTLPETFRVALVLRIYGDLSYQDIAVYQGIPVQTVKSRLWRARSMLHELLGPTSDTFNRPAGRSSRTE